MKKINSFLLLTFVVFLIFAMFNLQALSDEKKWELKLGSKQYETNPESAGVIEFIRLVEERTNGQVKIIPYFGEILGNSKTQMENVIINVQDFYVESYSFLGSYVPEFRVHALPYLFSGNEEYKKFLLSPIEEEMENKLIDKIGIRVINEAKNWLRGPNRLIASRKPILSLDDIQGLKLRQPNIQSTIKVWSALGANVIIIPWSEAYLAATQGIVDAVTMVIFSYYENAFCEVLKHVTTTNEYPQQIAIVMNEKKFQSLPKEFQEIIINSANEAGDLCTEAVIKKALEVKKENLETDHATGVTFYEPDLKSWRNKAREVHKELEETGFIPAGLIEKIHNYLGN